MILVIYFVGIVSSCFFVWIQSCSKETGNKNETGEYKQETIKKN
jgi:hypothetical protein